MTNDFGNTENQGLTTEQIAAAGSAPAPAEVPARDGREGYDDGPGTRPDAGYDNSPGTRPDAGYDNSPGTRPDTGYDNSPGTHPDAGVAASGYPTPDGDGSVKGPETRASLLEEGELQNITARWKDIQAEFVDEPTQAVQEADALVAELMQRLAAMFATERSDLEKRWSAGNEVSTEDLRQGLRRYRSFFERLLAA